MVCTLNILIGVTDAVRMPQGWKGSVKATHLVIALHDHFIWKAQYSHKKAADPRKLQPNRRTEAPNRAETMPASMLPDISAEDMWALEYITVNRIQSLMEALDDDGSSFVTVDEVNAFTSSRPEGWR